jgi:hypothetical protein
MLTVTAMDGRHGHGRPHGHRHALGPLEITPQTKAFADTAVGASSAPTTFTIKNSGAPPSRG